MRKFFPGEKIQLNDKTLWVLYHFIKKENMKLNNRKLRKCYHLTEFKMKYHKVMDNCMVFEVTTFKDLQF